LAERRAGAQRHRHLTGTIGTGVPSLLSGVNLSMVNLETALTNGTCPDP
jgi:hypothetical protein